MNGDFEKLAKLRWKDHESHIELLKEFYYYNKYIWTEQLKDTILDAIDCLEYVQKEKKLIEKSANESFSNYLSEILKTLDVEDDNCTEPIELTELLDTPFNYDKEENDG